MPQPTPVTTPVVPESAGEDANRSRTAVISHRRFQGALAAIAYTSIRPDRYWPRPGWPWPMDRPARLRMFCDAYGVEDRIGFLDAIEVFLQESLKETRLWHELIDQIMLDDR